MIPTRCYWSSSAPAGLADAAESWGMTRLADMFFREHRVYKRHDDGTGHCRVCGAPLDFDAWLDKQAEDDSKVAAMQEP